MRYLDGDTYFNEWAVPAQNPSQLPRCTLARHAEIFGDVRREHEDESGDEDVRGTELPPDIVVPFPREYHTNLWREMVHCFQTKILVDFTPGAGAKMTAVLLENIRGVAIAMTQGHKKYLVERLCEETRRLNLCRIVLPQKPPNLVAWESKANYAASTVASTAEVAEEQKDVDAVEMPAAPGLADFGSAVL